MTNESEDRDARLVTYMNVGNALIVLIFGLSLILEMFPIWIAIISSLLIWLIFGNILTDVANKWKQKAVLIEKGVSLHQYCNECGLRFSTDKSHCPKCSSASNQGS